MNKKPSPVQKPGELAPPPVEAGEPASAKKYHEIADAFPLMEGTQFEDLVADIKAHGLRNPITLFEDKVLDGRNRDRACLLAGVTPIYVPLPDNCSPLDFVISTNLKRRHLDESQRAMIAVKLANMRHGGDPKRSQDPLAISQAAAAAKMDVSVESVKRAKVVKTKGAPETIAAVEAGQLPVKSAAKIAQEPKEKQPVLVKAAGERKRNRKTAEERKAIRAQNDAAKKRKEAERQEHEHKLQLFAQTLIEKFERSLSQLLNGLEMFSNMETAIAIRKQAGRELT